MIYDGKVKENKATLSDIEIQNVIHIEQVDDGAISFSVIVSCDIEHSISSLVGFRLLKNGLM